MKRLGIALGLMALLAGCDETTPPDGGTDAGVEDAGGADAGFDAMVEPFAPDSYCPGSVGCTAGEGGTFE
ncbi:MAG: hypothetical protein KC619_18430, partial [Myxococcales bacterium]|nr:hypothetical protein [Myxococcales bacterium]